jgi:para-aminobenzoate synthetase/4-amino-4-deoxychorismate lyase
MADPVRVIEATRPADVETAIRQVQAEARSRQCHALGLIRYEAGRAFDLEVADAAPYALPLAWFALFESDHVHVVDAPRALHAYRIGTPRPSIDRDAFRAAFERIRQHIAAGDTYQVNCTFKLRADFSGDPLSLFADLAATQRGRHSAFIRVGQHAICSASPELFFSIDGDRIAARPMKGTASRGRTAAEDDQRADALRHSAKERAENVMIVDMMRNDIGRVAEVGTVDAPELFALERYPNVWQMTSTVTARTSAPLDAIIRALFPSASVTGAPKVRTMEIIRDIEHEPRGVYTGAIGYLTPDGGAQFNVAIRTAVVDERRGALEFGVGSGVVWDSDPDREYDECLLKGSVLGRRPEPFDLLETIRWTPEEGFFLLERHLARLQSSARYFGFECQVTRIRAALAAAVQTAGGPLRLRLLVAEDGSVRVEQAPLDARPGVWHVQLAPRPIDPLDARLFHKTTNRRMYEDLRVPGYDDVILWNAAGEITESTIANLVFEIEGRRVTPPVECGLLPGTLRAELLATGQVSEARVRVDELSRASGLWLVNSVRGWCPATLAAP